MDWKEFLRPNLKKILVFIIITMISVLLALIQMSEMRIVPLMDIPLVGFPIAFYSTGKIFLLPFIMDLIIWYLISCAIIFAFVKPKKEVVGND